MTEQTVETLESLPDDDGYPKLWKTPHSTSQYHLVSLLLLVVLLIPVILLILLLHPDTAGPSKKIKTSQNQPEISNIFCSFGVIGKQRQIYACLPMADN